mgnify:CR=1 FL=1
MRLFPRTETARVFLAAMLACIVAGWPESFTRGTYWDGTVGVMHQAVFLHETGMDYSRLFYQEAQYAFGGARTYPFSVYPPAQALLMSATRSPALWLALNHLLVFAAAAGCVTLMFRIVRQHLPGVNARLAAAVMVSQAFFLSQANAINLEIPVMLGGTLALHAFLGRRPWAAAGWLVAASLIKLSLLPFALVLGAIQLLRARRWREALAALPFFALVWGFRKIEAVGSRGFHMNDLSKDWSFQTQRLTTWREVIDQTWLSFSRVPDLVLMAGACLVLCGVAALWHAMRAGRSQPGGTDAKALAAWRGLSERPWLLIAAAAGGNALLFNLLIKMNLPRYLFVNFPMLLPGMFALLALLPRRWSSAALGLWLAVNLINLHGWIPRTVFGPIAIARGQQPEHLTANGFILERSLEGLADLRLQTRAARLLEEKYADRIIVAPWPLLHQFASPWFGHVRKPLRVMSSHWPSLGWAGVRQYWYVHGAEEARRGVDPSQFVWVWMDNVFARPEPSEQGRRTIETLREGDLKIEFFVYDDWPVPK